MPYLSPVYFPPLVGWVSTGTLALLLNMVWMPTMYKSNWYKSLKKPWFYPWYEWHFFVAWFIFYHLMGIATFFAWRENTVLNPDGSIGEAFKVDLWIYYGSIGLYLAHLLPLSLWGMTFFGMRNIGLSFVVSFITWVAAVLVAIGYFFVNMGAGFWFLAYAIWLTYVMFLNGYMYWLNILSHRLGNYFAESQIIENPFNLEVRKERHKKHSHNPQQIEEEGKVAFMEAYSQQQYVDDDSFPQGGYYDLDESQ